MIYYYVDRRERVYLVTAYAKSEREDLTRAEISALKALAEQLEKEA